MIGRGTTLVVPTPLHSELHRHLFPGDGLEAAALLLCTTVVGRRRKLLGRDLVLVPHDACARRARDALTWPGEYVEVAIDRAEREGLAVLAAHSHPSGYFGFSNRDDASDQRLMPALLNGTATNPGSAIMVPSGAILARIYDTSGIATLVDLVTMPGEDIALWWSMDTGGEEPPDPPPAFTAGMTAWLGRLSVCVVGVSGTGSVVAEQLARLGFGEVILIDFDKVEPRNLNRILNSTLADAEAETLKVDLFAEVIHRHRPSTSVLTVPRSIATREAVLAACECDVLFSCVDTAEGRHLADRLAAFFMLPLFDVGVSVPTRRTATGGRQIAEVCGRIDYVQPCGATLSDRGVYTPATLEAEYLAKAAPDSLRQKIAHGYLSGIAEQAPAVITLNMRAASACVMEFIARAFPFRHARNDRYARTIFMLADGEEEHTSEHSFSRSGAFPTAAGTREPLLGLPALTAPRHPI